MSHASKVMAIGAMAEVAGSAVGEAVWGLTGICAGWGNLGIVGGFVLLPGVLRVYVGSPGRRSRGSEHGRAGDCVRREAVAP